MPMSAANAFADKLNWQIRDHVAFLGVNISFHNQFTYTWTNDVSVLLCMYD